MTRIARQEDLPNRELPNSNGRHRLWVIAVWPLLLLFSYPMQAESTLLHSGGRYRLIVQEDHRVLEFCFAPGESYWGPVNLKINRIPVGDFLIGAGPVIPGSDRAPRLHSCRKGESDDVEAIWILAKGEREYRVHSTLAYRNGRLRLHFRCSQGLRHLSLGSSLIFHAKDRGYRLQTSSEIPYLWFQGGEPRPFSARLFLPANPSMESPSNLDDPIRLTPETSEFDLQLEVADVRD